MIEPKKDIERLKNSSLYKDWKETYKESYLSDFFCVLDKESSDDNLWQIDYYNPKQDTITSFELPADKRKSPKLKEENSKIFKKEGDAVQELSLSELGWSDENVIQVAKESLNEQFPGEAPMKTILILQHSRDYDKPIWNLTFMTSALNMFNARIDAKNGKIIDSSLKSAMSLKKEILPGTTKDDRPKAS